MVQRAGLIIPSSNRMVEEDMIRFYPADVVPHVTRLRMTGPNRKPLADIMRDVETAAAALADAKCDVITFHCTANSMSEGLSGEAALGEALKRGGAKRVSTTATAVKEALDALGAKKIMLVTPYDQEKTEEEAEFLHFCGYEVVGMKGYALAGSDAYCATPGEVWRERALAARHDDADIYFLSCANIRAIGIVAELEAALERPVITSNQVVIWDALRRIGNRASQGMPGQLFRRDLVAVR